MYWSSLTLLKKITRSTIGIAINESKSRWTGFQHCPALLLHLVYFLIFSLQWLLQTFSVAYRFPSLPPPTVSSCTSQVVLTPTFLFQNKQKNHQAFSPSIFIFLMYAPTNMCLQFSTFLPITLAVLCLSIPSSFPLCCLLIFPAVSWISQHWLPVLINLSCIFRLYLSLSSVSFPLVPEYIQPSLFFKQNKTTLFYYSPTSYCLIHLLPPNLLSPYFKVALLPSLHPDASPEISMLLKAVGVFLSLSLFYCPPTFSEVPISYLKLSSFNFCDTLVPRFPPPFLFLSWASLLAHSITSWL